MDGDQVSDSSSGPGEPAASEQGATWRGRFIQVFSDVIGILVGSLFGDGAKRVLSDQFDEEAESRKVDAVDKWHGRSTSVLTSLVGSVGGKAAGILARVFMFVIGVWLVLVRRRPKVVGPLTLAVAIALIVTIQVRDRQAEEAVRRVEAAKVATRAAIDVQAAPIFEGIDIDLSLADPVLFGRGADAVALRCFIELSNHNREAHTIELALEVTYRYEFSGGGVARSTVYPTLEESIPPGATVSAAGDGEPVLIELETSADRPITAEVTWGRLTIVDPEILAGPNQPPWLLLEPPPTGCDYARPPLGRQ